MSHIDYTANKLGTVYMDSFPPIHLDQQAYANNYGTDGGVRYQAHGRDDEGNVYLVSWGTTAAWDAMQADYKANGADPNWTPTIDEDEACDWDSPVKIEAV